MTDPTSNRDPGVVPMGSGSSEAHGPRLDELRAALELQREADAMIAEALDTRRAAMVRAETLVREAEQAAARAEEGAAAAASRRIEAAREEADRLLAEAQDHAHQITSDAETEVTAVRQEAADLRDGAQETIAAAELEWERARRAGAHHEQRLLATQTVAVHMIDSLEQVTATLEEVLERVRDEVASARRDLAQLHGDMPPVEADASAPSVVVQWPRDHDTRETVDPATTDAGETTGTSKHRRFANRNRRGPLRKARL